MTTFKVGDIVEWAGVRGEVTNIEGMIGFPVLVKFDGTVSTYCFTKDGRYLEGHTKPSIVLVERPRKLVKKTRESWGIVTAKGELLNLAYGSESDAERNRSPRERVVRLTTTYEVEEK